MKNKWVTLAFCASLSSAPLAFAEQGAGEKIETSAKSTKRKIKKGAHRLDEKMCMEGDAKCAAEKAKHRVQEGVDATKDKFDESKDKIDD